MRSASRSTCGSARASSPRSDSHFRSADLTRRRTTASRACSYPRWQYDPKLPAARVYVDNAIPLGKGLGSSAAAVGTGAIVASRAHGVPFAAKRLAEPRANSKVTPKTRWPPFTAARCLRRAPAARDCLRVERPGRAARHRRGARRSNFLRTRARHVARAIRSSGRRIYGPARLAAGRRARVGIVARAARGHVRPRAPALPHARHPRFARCARPARPRFDRHRPFRRGP